MTSPAYLLNIEQFNKIIEDLLPFKVHVSDITKLVAIIVIYLKITTTAIINMKREYLTLLDNKKIVKK